MKSVSMDYRRLYRLLESGLSLSWRKWAYISPRAAHVRHSLTECWHITLGRQQIRIVSVGSWGACQDYWWRYWAKSIPVRSPRGFLSRTRAALPKMNALVMADLSFKNPCWLLPFLFSNEITSATPTPFWYIHMGVPNTHMAIMSFSVP